MYKPHTKHPDLRLVFGHFSPRVERLIFDLGASYNISPWCDVNNPSHGLLAEHDARVHIVRLYLIICAHCVLNASENDTEKTRLYITITELWYSLEPDNWPPDP